MSRRKINRGAARRAELKEEAEARAEERATRTPIQQIAELDSRLGVEQGARKERNRLLQMIEDECNKNLKKKKEK
jgi:hypothetical protein